MLLNCLSSYSLLDSTNHIETLVQTAINKGYHAIGLTDINYLYGTIEFDQICKKNSVKPLFGLTLTYQSNNKTFSIVLLAKNNQGFNDLLKISSLHSSNSNRTLNEYFDLFSNIYILHTLENGELYHYLINEYFDEAKTLLKILEQYNNYLTISSYLDNNLLNRIQMFSEMVNIPLLASNQIKYSLMDDYDSYNVLQCIKFDEQIFNYSKNNHPNIHYIIDKLHWENFYKQHKLEQALLNTKQIINSIDISISYHQNLLPKFPIPTNQNSSEYLLDMVSQGKKRVKIWNDIYEKRLQKELQLIDKMGFSDYFLIIWDVMLEARRLNILTGPGRGSAAGSLVAYLLYITDVDPIKYNLIFERFLNPSRKTMPDIDLDFPDTKRDYLFTYLKNKYGKNQVARIITFGTLAAKQVIRDVTKAFGLTRPEQDEWAKAVYVKKHDTKVTLQQAYNDSFKLRQLVNRSERNKNIYRIALKLEGLPKNTSLHAAGIILYNQPLSDYIPIITNDDLNITQWSMDSCEKIGLLKMDFLSLKNLSIIEKTLSYIKFQTGTEINIKNIPLNIPEVYQYFSKGETTGIFQFESKGMRSLLRKIKVNNLLDLALVNALHRPGANLNPDELIDRRFGKKSIHYIDNDLEPILKETYGIMIYQEQVMNVAVKFAGFSLAEADSLRRAMSKKNTLEMNKEKEPFIKKSIELGHTKEQAELIFNQIAAFAGYGFNKSHAIAYSILAYQMMYLKYTYPKEFYLALIRSTNSSAELLDYISSMKKQNINLKNPNINYSQINYIIHQNSILMGLSSIKGLDKSFIEEIINERKRNGKYSNFVNFLERISPKYRKPEIIIKLIEGGCFDQLNHNRYELKFNLEGLCADINYFKDSFFDKSLKYKLVKVEEDNLLTKLSNEKKQLGFYVYADPTEYYKNLFSVLEIKQLDCDLVPNQKIRSIVLIDKVFSRYTKSNQKMLKVVIDNNLTHINATIFPDTLIKFGMLKESNIYLIEGTYKEDQFGQQIIIDYYKNMDLIEQQLKGEKIYILTSDNYSINQKIKNLLINYSHKKDNLPVIIVNKHNHNRYLLNEHFWISPNSSNFKEISNLLDSKNVIIK